MQQGRLHRDDAANCHCCFPEVFVSMRFVFVVLAACVLSRGAIASELEVVGTGDGMELLQAIATAYNAQNPDSTVVIPPSIGSGGGIAAVGADKNVLGRVARPLSDKEKAQGLVTTPIMRIPSAIYVHKGAGVTALSSGQLAKIYSGEIDNWKDVGGKDMKIKVVRREEADSTLSVLRASMPGWKDIKLTQRSKLAMTTQESIETVKEVEGAIGFGPYSRALESTMAVLRIDGRHPLDEAYPSAVTLALLHKGGALTPEAERFVKYVHSTKGRDLTSNWGAIPIF
jgi:phosphate transport system substrate-binding protein